MNHCEGRKYFYSKGEKKRMQHLLKTFRKIRETNYMKQRKTFSLLPAILFIFVFLSADTLAQHTDIRGPIGSGSFGQKVVFLPNGNIVVTDPLYDIPTGAADVGAVYLYNGSTGDLISTLTGSTANDQVGNGGVTVLTNGNYVVRSSNWDSPTPTQDVGAVTWGSATTGISGTVSAANSLIGSAANDTIGNFGITVLTNGNYVVVSPDWDSPALTPDVGAITWGNGSNGSTVGAVSAANSLVGSTTGDFVRDFGGFFQLTVLSNGNYVVISPRWDNGATVDAGAATWGNGLNGSTVGAVSSANSLVGSTTNDLVGNSRVIVLSNGNYVVSSPSWDSPAATDVGAVTWGNGSNGTTVGLISPANSLVGSTASDQVGFSNDQYSSVTALTNGNYVVRSQFWDNPTAPDVGAVTWGNGSTGLTVGIVSAANSLVGSTANDQVGLGEVTALTNGNYVVGSYFWDNGAAEDAGAATWGNGSNGSTVGPVSAANSLVGSTQFDQVGYSYKVTALTNGNYVVASSDWSSPTATGVGAVTWGNGSNGTTVGAVSAANSLVGSKQFDFIGSGYVTALTNGNYVVSSPYWDSPSGTRDVGAATWGNGSNGSTVGPISAANSLVNFYAIFQFIDYLTVTPLTNGNYVVSSPYWNSPTTPGAGAVTWGNGSNGSTVGPVSEANSLVGSTREDRVSDRYGVTVLTNGNYVVISPFWDSPTATDVGAVTLGNGSNGSTVGAVSAANSLVGSTADDQVGFIDVTALSNGNYVVSSLVWDNGAIVDAGAVSYLSGTTDNFAPFVSVKNKADSNKTDKNPTSNDFGPITMTESILGTTAGGGGLLNFSFNPTNNQLVVGRPADNIVTLFVSVTPTTASATVSGRVQNSSGGGIPQAIVSITDSGGQIRTAWTNSFGYYRFDEIPVSESYIETYIIEVRHKSYQFTPQVGTINDAMENFNFVADDFN